MEGSDKAGDSARGIGVVGVGGWSTGVEVREEAFLDFLDSVEGAGETDPLRFLVVDGTGELDLLLD